MIATRVSDNRYDFTKTQLVVLYVVLLLSVDSINPIKIFLHCAPIFKPWHIATLSILLMLYIFISEMKQLLYFATKIFFHSILSIFFREVSVVGAHNIPRYGPVIFTSNHANQFIDSVVILSTCQRTISYLMAEKSWKRAVVGHIAWAMGVVPVKRAQDSATKGSGTMKLSKRDSDAGVSIASILTMKGTGTKFMSELKVGDKIRLPVSAMGLKVTQIESDTIVEVDTLDLPDDVMVSEEEEYSYDILKKMDQKEVYKMVLSKLASGGTIGIFPEGGSHDRTDLLPLRVGVALIAYSALEQDGLNIPIVPVGLSYFQGHRFRGRVVVEYGRPTYVDTSTLKQYQNGGTDKRRVCNELMEKIEDNMRSVIVSVPDYETLKMIHTARRLYRSRYVSYSEKQDLSRRFAEGYKKLLLMTKGNPPKEWLELQTRLKEYQQELSELGIRDHQVPGLQSQKVETDGDVVMREMRLPFRICELILLLVLSFVPALLLNLPVGLIARVHALRRREKALKESKVKVKGMDVMLTEKVVLCIVLVPSLWMLYAVLLYCFTNLDGPAIALAIFCMPVFSYMGIVTAEAGMVDFKDLKPYLMRLYPSSRRRLKALPGIRRQLEKDLRDFIKMIGPSLGELYTQKELDWAQFQQAYRRTRKMSETKIE